MVMALNKITPALAGTPDFRPLFSSIISPAKGGCKPKKELKRSWCSTLVPLKKGSEGKNAFFIKKSLTRGGEAG